MARPPRHNADYYTHDADLRNDRRVKAIRTKFGAAGYGLLHMLLEALTDADHTQLDTAELEIELLAGDFGVSATEIHSLIQFAESIGYFTRNEAQLLICPELNKWLEPVFEKRNRSRNATADELLPQAASKTRVSVTENPQSKVKKSKVKDDVGAGKGEVDKPAINPARDAAIATGDPAEEQAWNESPLTKPHAFKAICDDNNFKGIDYEHYRLQLLDAAKNEVPLRSRKSPQWRSWIRITLNNRQKDGALRMADAAMPTELTPRHLLPAPGKETPGQIITVRGDHDQQMNRMLVDSHQRNWPTAIIHAIHP